MQLKGNLLEGRLGKRNLRLLAMITVLEENI